MSYLTTSFEELEEALIESLEGEGFSFNPLTTTLTEYLSTALGSQDAYLRKSLGRLLSDLDAQYGGSLSHLTSPITQLMDDVAANIGGGGGGGGYTAQAVHFDGAQTLAINSLTSTDSPDFTMSFWFNVTEDGPVPFFVNDPESSLSILVAASVSAGEFENFKVYVEDFEANKNFVIDASALPTTGEWHHAIVSVETDFPAGEKRGKIYIDRVDVTGAVVDGSDSFDMVSNGRPAYIGNDQGDRLIGDFAEFFVAPGLSVLDVAGNIPSATLDLFIDGDGKPVDLAGAVSALGNPRMLFSGDASGFTTNQGTGGTFVTGTYIRSDPIAGAGPVSVDIVGVVAGDSVYVVNYFDQVVTGDFESTITVNDQIQQTSATDFSGQRVRVLVTPRTLTNATTSPSD